VVAVVAFKVLNPLTPKVVDVRIVAEVVANVDTPLTPKVVAVVAANPETPLIVRVDPVNTVAVMGAGVTAPIGPGARQSLPSRRSALRSLNQLVVERPKVS